MANSKDILDVEPPKAAVESLPGRSAEPLVVDMTSHDYRKDVIVDYESRDPKNVYSWQNNAATERLLRGKRQEVITEDGKPVEDNMGDILVRQDREAFERKQYMERRMSLDSVGSMTQSVDPFDGKPDVQFTEDLVQHRNPKKRREPVAPFKSSLDEGTENK